MIRILQLCSLLLLVMTASIVFRQEGAIVGKPFTEDGFYAASVARNLALGRGLTIDGIQQTNGFQPLYVFLCSVPFILAGSNSILAFRLILCLHLLFHTGVAVVLGVIGRDCVPEADQATRSLTFWTTVVMYLSAGRLFNRDFNGLETALLVCCYAYVGLYYQRNGIARPTSLVTLGFLLGILVLARIDAAFFVAVFAGYHVLRSNETPVSRRILEAFVFSLVAAVVSSPWWIYNVTAFRSLMPTSGTAQSLWLFSIHRFIGLFFSLSEIAIPHVYFVWLPHIGLAVKVLRIFIFLAILGWVFRYDGNPKQRDTRARVQTARFREFTTILAISFGMLACWYTLSSFATWFYARYMAPLTIITIVISSLAVVKLFRRQKWLAFSLIVAVSVPLVLTIAHLHQETTFEEWHRDQLSLVRQHVPQHEVVAAFQTGTLGFFRERVVNLDGKVNPIALEYQGKYEDLLRKQNIQWVCDWKWLVKEGIIPSNSTTNAWEFIDARGDFVLYHFNPRNGGASIQP